MLFIFKEGQDENLLCLIFLLAKTGVESREVLRRGERLKYIYHLQQDPTIVNFVDLSYVTVVGFAVCHSKLKCELDRKIIDNYLYVGRWVAVFSGFGLRVYLQTMINAELFAS